MVFQSIVGSGTCTATMPSLTAPFLPVLVRPPGTSLLAAATPVPVCAATGHLPILTLRRYFPAATGEVPAC